MGFGLDRQRYETPQDGWAVFGEGDGMYVRHWVQRGQRVALCGKRMGGWHAYYAVHQDPKHPKNATSQYCPGCLAAKGLAVQADAGLAVQADATSSQEAPRA